MNRSKNYLRTGAIKPRGLIRAAIFSQIVLVSLILLSASSYVAPPIANDDSYAMRPNTELVVGAASGVLANDSDPDGDPLKAQTVSNPQNGTFGSFVTDGSFAYTPDENFVGVEEISYTITDGNDTATATLTIEVTNQPPVANDDSYTMRPNTELVVDAASGVLANDSDPDGDPLKAQTVLNPQNGTFERFVTDGSFTYIPNTGFTGVETITYTVTDGFETVRGSVTIKVETETNLPPVVEDERYTTKFKTVLAVEAEQGLLANDSDPDGDALEIVSFAEAGNGELNIEVDGAFKYQPYDGFIGDENIAYTVSDGSLTSEGMLLITVEDTPPVSVNSFASYNPQPLSRRFGGNWMTQEDDQVANFYIPASQRGGGIITATLNAASDKISPRLRVCDDSSCAGGSVVEDTGDEQNGATVKFQAAGGQDYHFDILQFGNAPEDVYPVEYSLSVTYEDRIDGWEENNTVEQAKRWMSEKPSTPIC